MEVIVVLIGAALLVAIGFLVSFLWATKTGQYDDLHTPAVRMLQSDGTEHVGNNNSSSENGNGTTSEMS